MNFNGAKNFASITPLCPYEAFKKNYNFELVHWAHSDPSFKVELINKIGIVRALIIDRIFHAKTMQTPTPCMCMCPCRWI